MVESVTHYYGWTKPEIQKSPTTWGGYLNDALDAIDGLIYANQQATVPIGAVVMWASADGPPANWLWCLGQVYNITDIPLLAPWLKNRFPGGDGVTTMAMPNFGGGASPVGYDGAGWALGASGGEVNHTLNWNEMPYHNHGVSDPTHAHSVWLGDPGHAHNIVTGGHSHGVNDPSHAHGYQHVGSGGAGVQSGAAGASIQNYTTNASGTGISIQAVGNLGGNTDARGTGMSVAMNAVGTGISVGYAGGGAAHNNMPPYLVIGFIIRYQ